MSTHVLGMSDLTSNQRTALQRLSNSNKHALRLIADLLYFTQARMGRGLPMAVKPLELHEPALI